MCTAPACANHSFGRINHGPFLGASPGHLGTMSHTVKSLCTRAGKADEQALVTKLVLYALAAMMAWEGGFEAWKKAQPPKQRGFSSFYAVMCSQAEGVRMHSVQKVQGHRRWCTDVWKCMIEDDRWHAKVLSISIVPPFVTTVGLA